MKHSRRNGRRPAPTRLPEPLVRLLCHVVGSQTHTPPELGSVVGVSSRTISRVVYSRIGVPPRCWWLRGERSPNAKLTEPEVRKIRRLEGQMHEADVGAAFGVSRTAVRKIWKRETWAHLE